MNKAKVGLFLRYLAIVLIPLAILIVMGVFSIVINQRFVTRQIQQSNARTLGQISTTVDFIFQELDSLDVIFSTSSEFLISLNRILAAPALDFEQSKVLSTIQNFLNVSAYARPYVDSIYVYIQNSNDRILTTTNGIVDLADFDDRGWIDSFRAHAQTDTFWTETRLLNRLPNVERGRDIISIYRRIYPLVGLGAPGVVVLNIKREYLGSILEAMKSSPDQRIAILAPSGVPVYTDFTGTADSVAVSVPEGGLVTAPDGVRYFAAQLFSSKYSWTYQSFTPVSRISSATNGLRDINIAVVCLSAVIGGLITFYASRRSFRQIEGVVDIVDASESGAPLPEAPLRPGTGFSHVTYSVLQTFLERKFLRVQLSERMYRQKTLELLALQSQMNPHFLFNTLETINWKVIELTKTPNQINDMIRSLSNILKYSLESPTAFETLENEIGHARDYLSIQSIRYKNKFTADWDCPSGFSDRRVIRFLLQPLLENAIYHGIREAEGRRVIRVSVRDEEGTLCIAVSDDGLGMEPDRLREVRAGLALEDGEESILPRSIGLYNTHKRIKLAYGGEYGLSVDSVRGAGTTVNIRIPSHA